MQIQEKNTETMYEIFTRLTGHEIIEKISGAKTEEEKKFYAELFNIKSKFAFPEVINEK